MMEIVKTDIVCYRQTKLKTRPAECWEEISAGEVNYKTAYLQESVYFFNNFNVIDEIHIRLSEN